MTELREKTLRGAFWSVLQQVVSRLLTLVIFAVLARLLAAKDFGVVALCGAFLMILEMLVEQGFSTAITQREALDPEHLDAAFWINIGTSVVLALGIALAAPLCADAFDEPALASLIPWMSLTLVFKGASGVQEGLLRRSFKFKSLAIRAIVCGVIGGTAAIVAAVLGGGAWALVIQQLVTSATGVLVLWGASSWRPRFSFSRKHAKELFGFTSYVLGASMLDFLNRRTDDFLIGYYRGATLLGIYTVAYRVLLIMIQLFASSVTVVAFSAFSRLQGDRERLCAAFYRATKLSALVAFPMFVGLILVAPDVVELLFGSKWSESVPVLRVLGWVGILHSLNYYFTTVYLAVNRADLRLKLLVVHTIASVTAFAIAIRWGIVAMALAYVIRAYLLVPIDLFALKKLIGLSIAKYLRTLVPSALATGVMAGVVLGCYALLGSAPLLVRLTVGVGAGAVSYAAAVAVLAPDLAREAIDAVRTIVQRKRGKAT